ncbi:MAG TPA: DUF3365 domain-containing protein [Terriglobia bacterium]|nr:DUF3365 domain-containing protein [Terriglobia bacterium]
MKVTLMKTPAHGIRAIAFAALVCAIATGLAACGKGESAASSGITPKMMADSLHAVMESDRVIYTKQVVNRLQQENVIRANEHWKDAKALPLPAQMFRMGSEMVSEKTKDFNYALLSLWAVNKQNMPKTDVEKAGLEAVVAKQEPYYSEETLGGKKYFTAVYPDVAVAEACINCHNDHEDSPRHDFKMGETMGGVVVRIPMI